MVAGKVGLMVFCSVVAILTTIGIVSALLFETIKFLNKVPLTEFLFGLNWEPQIPIREDQVAASGAFGWIPVMIGTLVVTVVVGLGSAPTVVAMATNVLALSRAAAAEAKPVTVPSSWVPETVRRWCRLLACAAVTVRANTLFESTLNC